MKKFNKLYELESLCLKHGYHISFSFLLGVEYLEVFPFEYTHFCISVDYDKNNNNMLYYTVVGRSLFGLFVIQELNNAI